ncbi:TolC family protein [Parapedobacter tibetensis]|uniref:TolC family protein n=1 Tax=Parapedobacter tibetensis TaxID=2972951 RepID=UPI00214DA720|nr:TolC family protein [Parapedobacter tibetensis]
MNLKTGIHFCIFLLVLPFGTFGQSAIEGDLIMLSELTLSKSPLIQRNALEIDQAEANLRTQRSTFDYQLSSGINASRNNLTPFNADPRQQFLTSNLKTNNLDFYVAMQKKLRTGMVADISTNYSRVYDNFPFNTYNEEVGPNVSDHATSTTLSLTQPLLRGNSVKVNTAFENAAKLDVESAYQNFELNGAFEVLQMGTTYWQYLGAFRSLEIFRENEDRVRNVLEITQELVKADKKPASDLVQIKADLAEQERQTTVALQNLYNARVNLGRAIGLNEAQSRSIGNPTNDFPAIVASRFNEEVDVESMMALARNRRSDIQAFQNTQDALALQLSATKNAVLPILDLAGFYTYGGAAVGGGVDRFFNTFGNRQGRNHIIGLSLTFSLPVNNNLALANLAKSKIALTDQNISYENLLRNIDLNVSIALNNLENSVSILEKAKETLEYYQEVFDNEQVRFQNGLTTLLNLILFQERLTFAQLEYLTAQQQFAVSIINLRYETGTLISMKAGKEIQSIERTAFYTIPSIH